MSRNLSLGNVRASLRRLYEPYTPRELRERIEELERAGESDRAAALRCAYWSAVGARHRRALEPRARVQPLRPAAWRV